MKMLWIFMLCALMFAVSAANVTYDSQIKLMMSGRQADMMDYLSWTGVILQDTPVVDPHFACLRVHTCDTRWRYQAAGTGVVFDCMANNVDKIACQPYSHSGRLLTAFE